jgi:hypothetical protein
MGPSDGGVPLERPALAGRPRDVPVHPGGGSPAPVASGLALARPVRNRGPPLGGV